jgi:hypothetical protein
VFLSIGAIALVSVGALVVAVRLGRPDEAHVDKSHTGRLALWARVDGLRHEIECDIEDRASQLLAKVAQEMSEFRIELEANGIEEAEKAVKAVRRKARPYFEATWPWDRMRFDLQAYAEEELLPLLVGRYDEFRKEMTATLVKRVESAMGSSLDSLALSDTSVGAAEGTRVGAIVAGGAGAGLAVVGVLGGAAAVLPVAAAAAAVAAGFYLKGYKSKEELAKAAMDRAEKMARRLFHGEGIRDPSDGTLIPSATYWLHKAANELETRVSRRIEVARDSHVRTVNRRAHDLNMRWEAGEVLPSQLRDPAFVAAALHPGEVEVARD